MTERDPETGLLALAQSDTDTRRPGDPPRPHPVDPVMAFSGRGAKPVDDDAQFFAQWGDDHSASGKKTVEAVSDVAPDGYTGPGSEHLPDLAEAIAEADEERARQTATEIFLKAWPDRAQARNSVVVQAAMFQASVIQAGIVYTLDALRDTIGGSRFAAAVTFYGGAAIVIVMRIIA